MLSFPAGLAVQLPKPSEKSNKQFQTELGKILANREVHTSLSRSSVYFHFSPLKDAQITQQNFSKANKGSFYDLLTCYRSFPLFLSLFLLLVCRTFFPRIYRANALFFARTRVSRRRKRLKVKDFQSASFWLDSTRPHVQQSYRNQAID